MNPDKEIQDLKIRVKRLEEQITAINNKLNPPPPPPKDDPPNMMHF